MSALTARDVFDAANRIDHLVHHTPVVACSSIDAFAGVRLFFKCENLQETGSFKYRGATSAVLQLDSDRAACGVVAYSTGNHAQGLALAARLRGIPAHVVVPRTIPSIKLEAIARHGACVHMAEPTMRDLVATTKSVADETGAVLISSSEHPCAIAGQGTASLELFHQVPDLDAVICPTGGGGLLAGACLAADACAPGARVFGAEPESADDAARSLAAGRLIGMRSRPSSIADGLLVDLAQPSWEIIRHRVAGIFTVTDDEIRAAMQLAWEHLHLLIEPSAGVALAAVLSEGFRRRHDVKRIGVILSGGNVGRQFVSAPRRAA